MEGNDLSNEVPKRILVTADAVTLPRPKMKKVLGIPFGTEEVREPDQHMLAALWRISQSLNARMELVVFGTDDEGDDLFSLIENRGTQPFNYVRAYESVHLFVSDLPYRPEVLGVIDTPDRAARYGSMAIKLEQLSRVI